MTKTRRTQKKGGKADTTNQGSKETQMAQGAKDQKETKKKRNGGRGPDKGDAAMGSTAQIDGAGSPG
eukprot:3187929-Ditylum_brightwellii.AAC.1